MAAVITPRGRGRPRKNTTASANTRQDIREITQPSGDVFISTGGEELYFDRDVDVGLIMEYSRNAYMGKIRDNRRRLIFTEKYNITVYDSDGKIRSDIGRYMMKMLDSPSVKLWNMMKIAEDDKFLLGLCPINPVWDYVDNTIIPGASKTLDIVKLRRLSPLRFKNLPSIAGRNVKRYAEFLQGVIYNPQRDEVEYWQEREDGTFIQIKNIFPVKDPNSPQIAGIPECLPIINLITMAKFVLNAQMQKINRAGAPLLFLKITQPKGDDIDYGKNLLANWGKDTAYILRENFELVNPHITDSTTCEDTIDMLSKMITSHYSPASLISKDGSVMNASSAPEQQLLQSYIRGIHSDIEDTYEPLLQRWLDVNGFEGFWVELSIPTPDNGVSEIRLKQVDVGHKTQSMFLNEKRKLLGMPLADDSRLAELVRYYTEDIANIPNTANHGTQQVIGSPQIDMTNKEDSDGGAHKMNIDPGGTGRLQTQLSESLESQITSLAEKFRNGLHKD